MTAPSPVDATVPVDARSLTMSPDAPARPTALTHVTAGRKAVSRALHPSTLGAYPAATRDALTASLRAAAVALDDATDLLDTTPGMALPTPTEGA